MVRWPIQVGTLPLLVFALYWCWRLYRAPNPGRPYLGFMLAWLSIAVTFHVFLVGRVVYYWGEPPLTLWIIWAANTLFLLLALSLALTYYVAAHIDA